MKKYISIIVMILVLLLPITAHAAGAYYIIDQAGLLSDQEIANLESRAVQISQQYGIDTVILTVLSLGGYSAQDYADDYYDYNGFDEDGLIFLLAMNEREWYIGTSGDVNDLLSYNEIDYLAEAAISEFSYGYYYGFDSFFDALPSALQSSTVSGSNSSGSGIGGILLISILIGAAAGGITVLVMRSSMNTKKQQRSAYDYMKRDSFHMRVRQDMFLYSQVTKTPRQQTPPSSGGGNSVHRSSSGRSHGGHGGKF